MTASACCLSSGQLGSATWAWERCLLGSAMPSLAERFKPRTPEEEAEEEEGSLRSESCSIVSSCDRRGGREGGRQSDLTHKHVKRKAK